MPLYPLRSARGAESYQVGVVSGSALSYGAGAPAGRVREPQAPTAPLPMSNIPMCMAIQSDNMYLAGDAGHPGPLGSQAAGSGAVGACGSRTRPAGAPAPYDRAEPLTTPTW